MIAWLAFNSHSEMLVIVWEIRQAEFCHWAVFYSAPSRNHVKQNVP